MSRMVVTLVDPLVDPPPQGWDDFAAGNGLLPAWDAQLLTTAAWCSQAASTMAMVREMASGEPVAAFHCRHLAPSGLRQFAVPGRVPRVTLTECRAAPSIGAGLAFADRLREPEQVEAVRVFERALRQRVGAGGRFIAYRSVPERYLPAVSAAGRARLRVSPWMVLANEWPDLASYLAALPGKWRNRLNRARHAVEGSAVRVRREPAVDPEQACWLVELVRRRHRRWGRTVSPPWPARYFARLAELPGSQFITYRDSGGRLLAFSAMYDDGVDLIATAWGSRDETDGGQRFLYFDLYSRQIEWLLSAGRRRLTLGAGMPDIKARFGARPEPRWVVLGLR